MTSTAIQKVDVSTGEVLTVERFDFTAYLADVVSPEAVARPQQLAAAYDTACRALIGPNDIQKDGGREFKKKSAWRKLQRHFGISTEVVRVDRAREGEHFIATVTVRAVAPWGQHAEAVGACGTDEESGRRKITNADAIATAETRATNRAVSNLIAMGEVSAEEIGDRAPLPESRPGSGILPTAIPFGKQKGKKLTECTDEELTSVRDWCEQKGKFTDLVEAVALEQDGRRERR